MSDETNKLLPCPWPECRDDDLQIASGSDMDLPPDTSYFVVECMSCRACGPWGNSANAAIEKWNSLPRTPNGTLVRAVAAKHYIIVELKRLLLEINAPFKIMSVLTSYADTLPDFALLEILKGIQFPVAAPVPERAEDASSELEDEILWRLRMTAPLEEKGESK